MNRLAILIILVLLSLTTKSQTVVSGKVTDTDGQPLARVSVMVEGTEIHTVTNDDGMFTLKTPQQPRQLLLSHIGYKSRKVVLEGRPQPLHIRMQGNTVELDEVLVSTNDPMAILKAAMARIEQNYSSEPELMRCFYRETARRGSRFISVARRCIRPTIHSDQSATQ